jgi:putative ABC transport system ATP-binding protein
MPKMDSHTVEAGARSSRPTTHGAGAGPARGEAIRLVDVTKVYPLGKLEVHALKGIALSFAAGEFTTIAGPSGCGKSTVLNLIGCMDTPTAGEVFLEGQPVSALGDKALTSLRLEKLGFIFQSFNLIPVLTVFQNVEFPLLLQGRLSAKERKERVENLLREVGLGDHMRHKSNELSGGQRQRVAIARALVTEPRIVLADEPTANLDSATGELVIDLMKDINRKHGTTFVFSTHDPQVMEHATRVVRLKDGLVVQA